MYLMKRTIFDNSHLSICQKGSFVKETINDRLNAIDWNNFSRKVVVVGSCQTYLQMGGPGKIVEIDESIESQWVFEVLNGNE